MAILKAEPSALRKMTQARATLVMEQTFFGTLALRLKLIEASNIRYLATDGVAIKYNPKWVATQSQEILQGGICHEVLHVANGHPWRADGRDMKDWNAACDYAINPIVLQAGMKLPEGILNDAKFKGQSAEQIYAAIHRARQQQPQGGCGAGGSGCQGQQPQQQQQQQPGQSPGDDGPPDHGIGEVERYVGEDAAAVEDEWKVAVIQAAQAAKMRGSLPGGLDRLIDKIKHPAADWKAILRRFMQQCAAADYTWRRPNRRFIAQGIYLPEIRSESMPPIMIGIDTSGSIDDGELSRFASELTSVVQECRPERVHVLYCDTKVHNPHEFGPDDPIVFKPKGGGGTNLPKLFDWLEEHDIEPACAIVFTDMETPFGEEPSYPVLWATKSKHTAPYGETVRIEEL